MRSFAIADSLFTTAKADCFTFPTEVYVTMPREIRDRVYFYLNTTRPQFTSELTEVSAEKIAANLSRHYPYWLLSDYVNPNFARESVQNFYKSTLFIFDDWPYSNIKKSLVGDYLGSD